MSRRLIDSETNTGKSKKCLMSIANYQNDLSNLHTKNKTIRSVIPSFVKIIAFLTILMAMTVVYKTNPIPSDEPNKKNLNEFF